MSLTSTKPRILVLGKYYPPFRGGIEACTIQICEALADSGFDVTVVVNNHERGATREKINDVLVLRRDVSVTVGRQPISLNLLSGIKLKNYDLVHFHAPNPFAAMLLWFRYLATYNPPPLVITHHMEIYGRKILRALTLPFYRALANRAKKIVFTSMKNARLSKDVIVGNNVASIPLGLDTAEYEITPAERELALSWRRTISGEAHLVGFVGRIARYKGLDVLITAVSQIDGLHCVIAGTGEFRSELEGLSDDLGVSERVHFLGGIDDLTKKKLLSSIDCFAFPSTEVTEAFGMSMIEAMAVGAPVVAADLPTGVTDVAIDQETALLVRPSDPIDLAAKIRMILSDARVARSRAARARQHVKDKFEERIVSEQYKVLFRDIISEQA